MIEKVCNKCGERLPLSMFHKHKGMADGHINKCKDCAKKQSKEWYENNKDKVKKQSKERYENNKDKVKKQQKEWRKKNKDKRKEYHKERYENNKEYIKEYIKENSKKPSKFSRKRIVSLQRYQRDSITGELGTRRAVEDESLLEVRCKQCNKWFKPTNSQVMSRIAAIKGKSVGVGAESHFYCSDECKNSCSIFKQVYTLKGFNTKSTREVDQFTIELCLERDNYECQRCLHEMDLEVHHIKGAIREPLLANDIDNVITLCSDCHKKVHAEEGCHYSDYKNQKRIN